ncbi:MAG: TIGR04282 family arsenosugar biosynthesis glycosyltransferase [Leptospirillia bacterium]
MTALVVFAKTPEPGQVKSRLAGRLGEKGAADLYRAFVHDMLARITADGPFDVTVAASPDTSNPFFAELRSEYGVALEPQGDGDLGARMANALYRALSKGDGPALLIGTDLPTLPASHINAAEDMLKTHTVVLGPATDGGYYLVGLSQAALSRWDTLSDTLFNGIPWSTPRVLSLTLQRVAGLTPALDVALAPAWYDVDEPDDLDRLTAHLTAKNALGLPRTRACLAALEVA